MIHPLMADMIRRRRGMTVPAPDPQVDPLMSQPGYGLEESNQGLPPLIREVPVRPGTNEHHGALPEPSPDDVEQARQMLEASPAVAAAAKPEQAPLVDHRDEDELYDAQEADRKSRLTAGIELAGRQLVGGITQTPVGQGIGANPSQVPAAQAAIKSRSERAAEAIRLKRQGVQDDRQAQMDASTLDLHASEAEKNRRLPVVGKSTELTPYQSAILEDHDLDRDARNKDRARKEAEAKAKSDRARGILADKKKAAGEAAEGLNIPFAGGMFRPRSGAKVDKQIAKEASDKASLYNSAISGIDDFASALGEYAANPGAETRDAVVAKANGVGGALNTAQGQGAMSEGEKKEMAAALGVNVLSPAGIEAFAQSLTGGDKGEAAKTITRRARAVRASMIKMAEGNLKSKNFDFEPGKSAAPASEAKKPVKYLVSPDKKLRVPVFADGSKGPEEPNG